MGDQTHVAAIDNGHYAQILLRRNGECAMVGMLQKGSGQTRRMRYAEKAPPRLTGFHGALDE
jgi:hypothetical protein